MCTTWNQKWKNWIRLYLFLMSSIHWCHKEIFPRQVQMAPDIFWNKNWRELRRWISVSLHLYHWVKVPVILRVKTKVFHQNRGKYPVSSLCIWTYHFVEKIFWNHPETKYEDYQRCIIFNEAVVFSLPASRQTEVPVSGAKKIITTCGTEE